MWQAEGLPQPGLGLVDGMKETKGCAVVTVRCRCESAIGTGSAARGLWGWRPMVVVAWTEGGVRRAAWRWMPAECAVATRQL